MVLKGIGEDGGLDFGMEGDGWGGGDEIWE
jgi:hypothetical protein